MGVDFTERVKGGHGALNAACTATSVRLAGLLSLLAGEDTEAQRGLVTCIGDPVREPAPCWAPGERHGASPGRTKLVDLHGRTSSLCIPSGDPCLSGRWGGAREVPTPRHPWPQPTGTNCWRRLPPGLPWVSMAGLEQGFPE